MISLTQSVLLIIVIALCSRLADIGNCIYRCPMHAWIDV